MVAGPDPTRFFTPPIERLATDDVPVATGEPVAHEIAASDWTAPSLIGTPKSVIVVPSTLADAEAGEAAVLALRTPVVSRADNVAETAVSESPTQGSFGSLAMTGS